MSDIYSDRLKEAIEIENKLNQKLKAEIKELNIHILQIKTNIARDKSKSSNFAKINYFFCRLRLFIHGASYKSENNFSNNDLGLCAEENGLSTTKYRLYDLRRTHLMFPKLATDNAKRDFIAAMKNEDKAHTKIEEIKQKHVQSLTVQKR